MVNKQGKWTMKTAIKYFWPFGRFRIEGQKHFFISKIGAIFLIYFFIKEYIKGRPTFIIDIFGYL